MLLFSKQPCLQAIEIDIDDWRRIERENLRQCEAAYDGVAERLTNLRSYTAAEHHRNAAKQRRHRGHQDRPEAHDAGSIDGLLGRQPLFMLDVLGKIDQHDSVLLDDADEQYDADDRDHAEIEVNGHQEQQCTEAGRRQGRDDGDWVNQALVQHTEDEVDDEERGDDEDRRA